MLEQSKIYRKTLSNCRRRNQVSWDNFNWLLFAVLIIINNRQLAFMTLTILVMNRGTVYQWLPDFLICNTKRACHSSKPPTYPTYFHSVADLYLCALHFMAQQQLHNNIFDLHEFRASFRKKWIVDPRLHTDTSARYALGSTWNQTLVHTSRRLT